MKGGTHIWLLLSEEVSSEVTYWKILENSLLNDDEGDRLDLMQRLAEAKVEQQSHFPRQPRWMFQMMVRISIDVYILTHILYFFV